MLDIQTLDTIVSAFALSITGALRENMGCCSAITGPLRENMGCCSAITGPLRENMGWLLKLGDPGRLR